MLKDKTLSEVAIAVSKQLILSYLQLPHEIHKTLRRLNEGTLSLQIKGQAEHTRKIYILGHQILYAGLGVAGLFLSSHWRAQGATDQADYALYGSAFLGVVLMISFVRNRT